MSRPDTILDVLSVIMQKKPQSILEVGCGDGFYGMLFRRYLDGNVEDGRGLHKKLQWRHHIDGIEIYQAYRTPVHDYFYNKILWGLDAVKYFENEKPDKRYDCIFMGDVIEHIPKDKSWAMIKNARNHLNEKGILIITTPLKKTQWNKSPNENKHEAHLSLWDEYDFDHIDGIGFKMLHLGFKVKLFVVIERK
jgi:cyclopropane fatty-acyl-phospholipid synthase-like methyltransferase